MVTFFLVTILLQQEPAKLQLPEQVTSATVKVGDVELTIPAPPGYRLADHQLRGYQGLLVQFTEEGFQGKALFLPKEGNLEAADAPPPFVRLAAIGVFDFESQTSGRLFLRSFKRQYNNVVEMSGQFPMRVPNPMATQMAAALGNTVVVEKTLYPITHSTSESVTTLFSSGFSNGESRLCTVSYALAKNKLIILIFSDDRLSKEELRAETERWVNEVVAANPSTAPRSVMEQMVIVFAIAALVAAVVLMASPRTHRTWDDY